MMQLLCHGFYKVVKFPESIREIKMDELSVIGAGLAGCEAAWQAAERGIHVSLYEMRPQVTTGAHTSGDLAELVCSNSLGSLLKDHSSGMLKEELQALNSLLINCAKSSALPAGNALAVDRHTFSNLVTEKISSHPRIHLIRKEVQDVPNGTVIICSGPLTSPALSQSIQVLLGLDSLYFFDALAPIISGETIDMNIAFRASRFDEDSSSQGDYINCPFDKNQYQRFVEQLKSAIQIPLKSFETGMKDSINAGPTPYFEGCLPIEEIARRGDQALAFGPMRPIGLFDPHLAKKPYAVVQLRQDDLASTFFNIVGFQTNLQYSEQKRVFRLIPGLENAEFERFGQMHRNTFIASPIVLKSTLQSKEWPDLFFGGQITGVEGYLGNVATGLIAGINAALFLQKRELIVLPPETMIGALLQYITSCELSFFQPMKANHGLLPPLSKRIPSKKARGKAFLDRSQEFMEPILRRLQS
jgi:methylenetetrahydrofolate--tRNA-(uracil-5-)-methyltransferase